MCRHAWVMVFAALGCAIPGAPARTQPDDARFLTMLPEDVEWKSSLGLGVSITTIYGDPTKPEIIKTVWNEGYIYVPPPPVKIGRA